MPDRHQENREAPRSSSGGCRKADAYGSAGLPASGVARTAVPDDRASPRRMSATERAIAEACIADLAERVSGIASRVDAVAAKVTSPGGQPSQVRLRARQASQ